MVLPGLDVAVTRHFCEQRVPPHALHQVRLEADVSATAVTSLSAAHRGARTTAPSGPVRVLLACYVAKHRHWILYWRDRNQPEILTLLGEVDRDPTCIFWG